MEDIVVLSPQEECDFLEPANEFEERKTCFLTLFSPEEVVD
jgi:hypothetical protein